ncbi:MAG: hypothetical protein WBW74_01790, partial [Xanthobacteraceae bacterium]
VSSGTLAVIAGAGVSGNGTASVTIAGTAAQINAALAGLAYTGNLDFNGGDTLTVATSDGTAIDTDTIAITVNATSPSYGIQDLTPNGGMGSNPATPPAPGRDLAATGDFNGYGIDGLMWNHASTGATSEGVMSPNGGMGSNPATPSAQGWGLAATGDFNGYGIDDQMWNHASAGVTSEWLM